MSPIETKGLDYFTGRKKFIEEITNSLARSDLLLIGDTRGIQGIGKTTLLAKLYKNILEKGQYAVIWLDIAKIGLRGNREDDNGAGADARSVQALVRNVYAYRRFMLALAQEMGTDGGQPFAGFEADVDRIYDEAIKDLLAHNLQLDLQNTTFQGGNLNLGLLSRLAGGQVKMGDVIFNLSVPDESIRLADGAIEMAVSGLQQAITVEFVERLNALSRQRRLVVIVDNYQEIVSQPMGDWIRNSLLPELRNVVIVLARMSADRNLYDDQAIVALPLDNFSREEVEEYVRKRLGQLPPPPGLVDRIYQFSGGHPQVVSLAVDLAVEHGLDRPDLLNIFANLPRTREDQLAELVKKIALDIEDENVRRALEIGWVLRRFDGDLLRFMMSDAAEPTDVDLPAQYEDIITRLEHYSFTEHHPSERDLAEYWKFHDFIRSQIETRLRKNSRDRVAQLHQRAAAYYAFRLKQCEEQQRSEPGGAKEYLCWYNYENPKWQSLKGEWLYHLACTPNRTAARLAFANVYLDAFWWWGCYRPFPFCDELLKDWRETQTEKDDQNWLQVLIDFQEAYPTGYEKYGQGDWNTVRENLVFLRENLGLNQDLERLVEDERHTRAMLDLFLAHSFRYADRERPEADDYYAEALAIFQELEDHWNQGWTLYEQGDLAMERGQMPEALDRTTQAWQLANLETVQDRELMGNCYRARADVAWAQGRVEEAFANYSAAIFYAYAFQAYPHAPDFYTVDFLGEMIARTRARLTELCQAGRQPEALRACEQMEQFWTPYWQAAGPRPAGPSFAELIQRPEWVDLLTTRLFPPVPTEDELGNSASRYVRRVIRLYDEMRKRIDEQRAAEDKKVGR